MPIWVWVLCGMVWWAIGTLSNAYLWYYVEKGKLIQNDAILALFLGLGGPMTAIVSGGFLLIYKSNPNRIVWPPSKWKRKGRP